MQSKGIEPLSDEWKSPILPLNHDCRPYNILLRCKAPRETLDQDVIHLTLWIPTKDRTISRLMICNYLFNCFYMYSLSLFRLVQFLFFWNRFR